MHIVYNKYGYELIMQYIPHWKSSTSLMRLGKNPIFWQNVIGRILVKDNISILRSLKI